MWYGVKNSSLNKSLFYFNNSPMFIITSGNCRRIVILYNNYYLLLKINVLCILKVLPHKALISFFLKFTSNHFFLVNKYFSYILKVLFIFLFIKIKFQGKGYYLYKNKRLSLGLQFNYSHKVNLYINYSHIKNFSKRSWIFFGTDYRSIIAFIKLFKSYRPINIFTLRGIRFTKQVIYKKIRKG